MRMEDLGFAASEWSINATANNGVATATKAGVGGKMHFITGVTLSASGAVAAPVEAQIKDGTTALDKLEIPAAAFAPVVINFQRPLRCTAGNDAVFTCPALGSGVTGSVTVRGFTRQ